MLRVWCEHLPLVRLREPAVLDLLARYEAHPIVAAKPDIELDALADALSSLTTRGLTPGVWPLLNEDAGYWPSERNFSAWAGWAFDLLDELEQRDARPVWVAVDLEPPIQQVARLLRRPWAIPVAAAALALENMDIERFESSRDELRAILSTLRDRGHRTLGVTLPLAAHDLRDGISIWEDMFETPWTGLPWDAAGIMAYGSIIAGASRGAFTPADARAIHQPLLAHIGRELGTRAHASIGITGAGVFGDEPAYEDPAELARDASAARAAGIEDIAVFCLEGILARPDPEAWLAAVADAVPCAPEPTWKSRALRKVGASARSGARLLFGR